MAVCLYATATFAIDAIWTGSGDGVNYSDPANWDINSVPLNTGNVTFNVTIPADFMVSYDVAGSSAVSRLSINDDATFGVDPGTSLTVLDGADIIGILEADDGNFTVVDPGALPGDRARISAINGASVVIGANALSSTGLFTTRPDNFQGMTFFHDLLSASGASSQIDLSSVQSIDAGFNYNDNNDFNIQRISASSGGTINLPGVTDIMGPVRQLDRLDVLVSGNGSVDLSSLQTIDSSSRGRTRIELSNGGGLSLPSLELARNTVFDLSGGATLEASGLAAAVYSSTGLIRTNPDNFGGTTFTHDLMKVTDSGSLLDLSAIQSIDAGFDYNDNNDFNIQRISASSGGTISLSGVTDITGPVRQLDRLDILVSGNGSVDLSSLRTIDSSSRGRTRIELSNGGGISLPSLELARNTVFDLSGGATLEASGLAAAVYSSTGLIRTNPDNFGGTTFTHDLMKVADSGSLLDLSAIQSIDAGFDYSDLNDRNIHVIDAADGGTINLAGVKSIAAPVRPADRIDFSAGAGSTIDLSTLESIESSGSGKTTFNVNDGRLVLGNLSPGSLVDVAATGSSAVLDVLDDVVFTESSTLVLASGATFEVGGGVTFTNLLETEFDLDEGTLLFDGSGTQSLEVGGLDVDIEVSLLGDDNFGLGELIVGTDGQSTLLRLFDSLDNGNRGGGSEALYMFGLGGEDGLRILGGSTLFIGGINAYALVAGELTHLNGLFAPEETIIPFDNGFIAIPEPSTGGLLTLGVLCNAMLRKRRRDRR